MLEDEARLTEGPGCRADMKVESAMAAETEWQGRSHNERGRETKVQLAKWLRWRIGHQLQEPDVEARAMERLRARATWWWQEGGGFRSSRQEREAARCGRVLPTDHVEIQIPRGNLDSMWTLHSKISIRKLCAQIACNALKSA